MIKNSQETSTDKALKEMEQDMFESGMGVGEIESCLIHWKNKYIITPK